MSIAVPASARRRSVRAETALLRLAGPRPRVTRSPTPPQRPAAPLSGLAKVDSGRGTHFIYPLPCPIWAGEVGQRPRETIHLPLAVSYFGRGSRTAVERHISCTPCRVRPAAKAGAVGWRFNARRPSWPERFPIGGAPAARHQEPVPQGDSQRAVRARPHGPTQRRPTRPDAPSAGRAGSRVAWRRLLSRQALTGTGQGGFHHPALPPRWLTEPAPRGPP